jgi:phospholipid transport system substrate-binding protein
MLRFFALLLIALALPMAAQAASAPADTVTGFHDVLIDNMKHGKSYSCGDRIQRLLPAVDSTFDMPFLSQHVLRRQWASLSPAQQAEFTATLKDMIVTTYASQFVKYNGEKFTTLDTEDSGGHRVVHARLDLPSGDPVHFDYVLRETAEGWRTVNVIAEGVSDMALRSAQYDKVFKDKGFNGLIAQIREQTAKLKSSC